MDVVLLGAGAGLGFGAMTVAVRYALGRGGDPLAGSAVNSTIAAVILTLAAIPSALGNLPLGDLWPFFLIGGCVPGASQFVFIEAVRHAGPARAAIAIGTVPLLSVFLALVLLDEPFKGLIVVGTALIVVGGAVLVRERHRPTGFRALGIGLGLTCAVLFAGRDNAIRWAARDYAPPALQAAAVSLLGAAAVACLLVLLARRDNLKRTLSVSTRAFAPAGMLLAVSYLCLVTGLDRGRVGIVAPLNATQSLWSVVLATVFFHATEAIGRRTFLAGALVVAGGVLIGVVR